MSNETPQETPALSPRRWWVVSLLFLATVINYLDRQTLSVLAPELRDRFHMSNAQYSHILFAFLLAYMIMQSGSGRLMDRLGTRRGFSLTMAWWSAAAMLHSVAGSASMLGFFRFLLGMGEAGNWPGAVKSVTEWFPVKQRAFAIGFFNSGSTMGAVIAPPLVTWIALRWGWQSAFLVTGSAGFLWLWLWLATVGKPPRPIEEEAPGQVKRKLRWRDLLRYREVWAIVTGRMLSDPVWWFFVFWLPEYLRRVRHFSLAEIGYFAWIPFLAADAGCIAGGLVSGWLIRRGWRPVPARKAVMAVSAVAMLAGIPAVLADESSVALALISIVTFSYSMYSANILALATDLFPQEVVASVTGLGGTGAALGGMAFNLLVGVVVDRFSYVPVFVLAGIMPLLAVAGIFAGIRNRAMVAVDS